MSLEQCQALVLERPTVSVAVAATLYGVSIAAMYRYCAAGDVAAVRVGKRWRVLSEPVRDALRMG